MDLLLAKTSAMNLGIVRIGFHRLTKKDSVVVAEFSGVRQAMMKADVVKEMNLLLTGRDLRFQLFS